MKGYQHSWRELTLSTIWVACLLIPCVVRAQNEPSPLPAQEVPAEEAATTTPASQMDLFAAKTVAVVAYGPKRKSVGGRILRTTLTNKMMFASAEGAKKDTLKALRKWGRYRIVEEPAKADLVFIITERDSSDPFKTIEDQLDVVVGGPEWEQNAKAPISTSKSMFYVSHGAGRLVSALRKSVEEQEKERAK